MYASCWRLYVRTTTEANSPGGEGQSTSGLSKKNYRYPYSRFSIPLYKTTAVERFAREAASYLCRSLPSILSNMKEYYKVKLTSFYICIPSV